MRRHSFCLYRTLKCRIFLLLLLLQLLGLHFAKTLQCRKQEAVQLATNGRHQVYHLHCWTQGHLSLPHYGSETFGSANECTMGHLNVLLGQNISALDSLNTQRSHFRCRYKCTHSLYVCQNVCFEFSAACTKRKWHSHVKKTAARCGFTSQFNLECVPGLSLWCEQLRVCLL